MPCGLVISYRPFEEPKFLCLHGQVVMVLGLFDPEDEAAMIFRPVFILCYLVQRTDENFLRLTVVEPQSCIL